MVAHSGVAFARWLLDAMQRQIPVIYFLGTSPGRYRPIIPAFIVGWRPERLRAQLAFGALVGASAHALPPERPSAGMRFARSRHGCIRHRSEMRSLRRGHRMFGIKSHPA